MVCLDLTQPSGPSPAPVPSPGRHQAPVQPVETRPRAQFAPPARPPYPGGGADEGRDGGAAPAVGDVTEGVGALPAGSPRAFPGPAMECVCVCAPACVSLCELVCACVCARVAAEEDAAWLNTAWRVSRVTVYC